jgi:hypothetical protein
MSYLQVSDFCSIIKSRDRKEPADVTWNIFAMETKTVVCEAKCGRYKVGVVLQSGPCRGILIVLTWNSKCSREIELNGHTLTDEELRSAFFWVVTQGVVVSCVMTQKSAVLKYFVAED